MATIGRTIAARVSIDWDFDGTGSVESGRLVSARGSMRLAPPGQAITGTSGIIATLSIELDNSDNRYSPLIAGSPLAAYIAGGGMYRMPILFEVDIDGGGYGTVFTGLLKIPRHRTLAPGQPKTLTLDARGQEERYLNQRLSTAQLDFQAFHDYGVTEADIILDILANDLGLSSGEYSIDAGMFPIPWFVMDDESITETLWRLAAAAGGRFYCRQDGIFKYENALHWLTDSRCTSSQATFTRADFESLTLYYSDNDLADSVVARANLSDLGESGELWSASEPLTVPADDVVTITAEFNAPAYSIASVTYNATSAGGTDLSGDIALVRVDYAQRMTLEFTNANTTLPIVITNLVITGIPVTVSERISIEKDETVAFWDNSIYNRKPGSLPRNFSNPYIQTRAQAESLAEFVRDRQQQPTLFYQVDGVQGDPARQLGDLVTINDAEQMDSARTGYVIGIDWSYSLQGGFRQSLTVVDSAGMYPYTGDYFVLGTDVLAGGKVLFY